MNSIESLLEKINNAKELDFGDVISESVDLYKKIWLKGFLVILFLMIGGGIIGFVYALIGLAPENNLFGNGFELESLLSFYSTNAIYSLPRTIT